MSLDWHCWVIIHTAKNHDREERDMFQMSVTIMSHYSDMLKLRSLAPISSRFINESHMWINHATLRYCLPSLQRSIDFQMTSLYQ